MKLVISILLLLSFIFAVSCNKNKDGVRPINCDGLVTDTTGTGDNGRVFIANAFTPNGDGKNDIARPFTENIASLEFTIYDENNVVVFATTTLGQGWSTTVGNGSYAKYYFKIQAVTNSNHRIGMCGELYKLSCYPRSISAASFYFQDQLTPFGFTGVTSETLSTCP